MFKIIWVTFAPPRKPYRIRLLFIHKNGWGGLMSVTERSYGLASISKAESLVGGGGVGGYMGYLTIIRRVRMGPGRMGY